MVHTLDKLFATIECRKKSTVPSSWTATLLHAGTETIADKVLEEAREVIVEALARDKDRLVAESADLLYHLYVLWADAGVKPQDVYMELQRREHVSGLVEKRNRKEKTDKG